MAAKLPGNAEPGMPLKTITRLNELDRSAIFAHLSSMGDEDCILRFGNLCTGSQLNAYVENINFNRDIVLGAFEGDSLIGVCHLAAYLDKGHPTGEIGISVSQDYRRKGIGSKLMDAAFVEATSSKITQVYLHFLRQNRRMATWCLRLGVGFEPDGDECTALISLHPQGTETMVECIFVGVRKIEVFQKGPLEGKSIIFVHGAGGDGWHWRQHFMPYLSTRGARCSALSLRCHGKSARQVGKSFDDFVEDLAEIAALSTTPPILVGHCMGGLVVQRYLESYPAERAVLLNSLPPQGIQGVELESAQNALKSEFSRTVLGNAMKSFNPIDLSKIKTPVTVIGGAHDKVVPPPLVLRTARAYNSLAHFLPEAGHASMLGRNWKMAADLI